MAGSVSDEAFARAAQQAGVVTFDELEGARAAQAESMKKGATVSLAVLTLVWCAGARAEGLTLYVAPNGNDAWSGKAADAKDNDGPFATIARARDAIRQQKAQGGLTGPVSVRIRGGTYFLSETLTFTPEDAGTKECPISYEAAAGERPVLCGGKRITAWRPHQGKIQVALIPEVQAGKWYFRSLFADGVRQVRARYPNVEPSDPYHKGFLYADRNVQGFGLAVGNIHNPGDWMEYNVEVPADGEYAFWVYYGALNAPYGNANMDGRTVLIVDGGTPAPLMNLPDTGGWGTLLWSSAAFVRLTKGEHVLKWQNVKGGGLNLGAYVLSDEADWKPVGTSFPKPAAGKHRIVIQAANFVRSQGKQLSVSGTASGSCTEFFHMPGTFKPSWAAARDVEIHVFQSSSCRAFKEIVSLVKVGVKDRCVTIGGRECVTPVLPGDRYFVENLFEELDSPGEWYLNRETGQLFYWPQDDFTDKTKVLAPVLGRVVQVLGNAAEKKTVSHLKFSGLAFQETDYSPDDGCVGYGMGTEGVVHLANASHCAIADCTFRNIGKYAVYVTGGGDNRIVGNDISDSAEGGLLLSKTARNIVSDNHIHHCGAVYKHIGGMVIEGTGADENVVSHDTIHDMSRYGISLKNPGCRNIIEFNRVERTNTETYDTGGIEVTQHDKDFRSGSVIRYNIVGDTIGYSSDGGKPVFLSWSIYLDSFAGGYDVNHNICYRSHNGGIMLQGGKDNRVTNNVFVDGETSQGFISNFDSNSTGQVMERNIFCFTNANATLFATGKLTDAVIRMDHNLYFCPGVEEPGVGWGGQISLRNWQRQGFDMHSVVADPRFVEPKRDNYALRSDSPAFKLGFEAIDTSRIGLLKGRCRCPTTPGEPP